MELTQGPRKCVKASHDCFGFTFDSMIKLCHFFKPIAQHGNVKLKLKRKSENHCMVKGSKLSINPINEPTNQSINYLKIRCQCHQLYTECGTILETEKVKIVPSVVSAQNSVKANAELKVEKGLPDSNTSSSTLLLDTTDEHRIHLFDLNCRICTGKMAPPGEPPRRETPAPLVSTTSM